MKGTGALMALAMVLQGPRGSDGFGVATRTTARPAVTSRLSASTCRTEAAVGRAATGAAAAAAAAAGGGRGARRSRGWGVRMQSAVVSTTASAVDLSGDGGVTREMIKEGKGKALATGDIAMVSFTGTVATTGVVFSKGSDYRTTLEDGTMISGWDTGLAGLRPGDRAIIRCSSRYGYGKEGVTPIVPPHASLIFDVELIENEGNIMNPATFVDASPLTPRTPDSIAQAFDSKNQQKRQAMAEAEELEGLDKAIAWVKNIYIFGLFEGETGEEAPWYLKPLITFPIMIAFCGVTFYAVILLGGVTTDRGSGAVQDDPMLASLGFEALRQLGEALA